MTDNHFQGSLGQGQPERRCFSNSETVRLSHLAEKETEALRNENWIVMHLGASEQVCVCVSGRRQPGFAESSSQCPADHTVWAAAFSICGEPGSGEPTPQGACPCGYWLVLAVGKWSLLSSVRVCLHSRCVLGEADSFPQTECLKVRAGSHGTLGGPALEVTMSPLWVVGHLD